jgi:hypothetical protein
VIPLAPGPSVPPEYIGVWKRTLLRTPKVEDTTTEVYWMQTESWHADIRVPASRPSCKGKLALDQLTRDELFALARQQGFSGTTVVERDICRWLRQYDFQPPSGANDIGRMVFETPDRVLEYGVEAEYFEIWERVPGSQGESFATQLPDEPLTLYLGTGDYRMIVRPRKMALPTSPNMSSLAADKSREALQELMDFEISFGKVTTADAWRISLSTMPWREGEDIR